MTPRDISKDVPSATGWMVGQGPGELVQNFLQPLESQSQPAQLWEAIQSVCALSPWDKSRRNGGPSFS